MYNPGAGVYLDPLSDPGFKMLFGRESSKSSLMAFLNSVLDAHGHDPITDVSFLDKEKVRESQEERTILFDILCETSCGRRFIVEMQNATQPYFMERTEF